jgi:endonuclease YncB( thermonuclease family)
MLILDVSPRRRPAVPIGLAAVFAAGALAGGLMAPQSMVSRPAAPTPMAVAAPAGPAYVAELVRVLDGDTFEARVKVWPGMEAVTRVRLRGIDAPEMKARCETEHTRALAARDALADLLSRGSIAVSNVAQDKYGGRIDADVGAGAVGDVASVLLERGLVRRYGGGRRASWCDAPPHG